MEIGKYTLERQENNDCDDLIWIYITDDGEGMTINEERFESLLDDYYKENF